MGKKYMTTAFKMQGEAIKHSSTWKKFTGKIILKEMWLQSFNVQAGMNKNNHFKI